MENLSLSLLIWCPVPLLVVAAFLPKQYRQAFFGLNLLAALTQLGLGLLFFLNFREAAKAGVAQQFAYFEDLSWFSLSIGNTLLEFRYTLGMDGLSATLILLHGIVFVLAAMAGIYIKEKYKGYSLLFLLLSISVPACFVVQDFLLFYLFFEFMLLPMFLLIGIWGGARKEYAAMKFFLYTLVGSLFILLAMMATILATETPDGAYTLNFIQMAQENFQIPGGLLDHSAESSWRYWVFAALVIGFAVKLPAVPLHTWLPDAHVEAPTPVSVILAGILLKIGGYGLIRFPMALFPDIWKEHAYYLGLVAVLSIVYGALNALAQQDLKKMIAYSSVSHMGFVTLGLAASNVEGISGAVFQMFSHGLISAALFLVAGVLYAQTHDRSIDHYGGLAQKLPYYSFWTALAFFAGLGLPGFSGFIGEVLVIIGAYSEGLGVYLPIWMPILAGLGIALSAAYFLWTYRRMFFGKYWLMDKEMKAVVRDVRPLEFAFLAIPVVLALLFGIFPSWILGSLSAFSNYMLKLLLI